MNRFTANTFHSTHRKKRRMHAYGKSLSFFILPIEISHLELQNLLL